MDSTLDKHISSVEKSLNELRKSPDETKKTDLKNSTTAIVKEHLKKLEAELKDDLEVMCQSTRSFLVALTWTLYLLAFGGTVISLTVFYAQYLPAEERSSSESTENCTDSGRDVRTVSLCWMFIGGILWGLLRCGIQFKLVRFAQKCDLRKTFRRLSYLREPSVASGVSSLIDLDVNGPRSDTREFITVSELKVFKHMVSEFNDQHRRNRVAAIKTFFFTASKTLAGVLVSALLASVGANSCNALIVISLSMTAYFIIEFITTGSEVLSELEKSEAEPEDFIRCDDIESLIRRDKSDSPETPVTTRGTTYQVYMGAPEMNMVDDFAELPIKGTDVEALKTKLHNLSVGHVEIFYFESWNNAEAFVSSLENAIPPFTTSRKSLENDIYTIKEGDQFVMPSGSSATITKNVLKTELEDIVKNICNINPILVRVPKKHLELFKSAVIKWREDNPQSNDPKRRILFWASD